MNLHSVRSKILILKLCPAQFDSVSLYLPEIHADAHFSWLPKRRMEGAQSGELPGTQNLWIACFTSRINALIANGLLVLWGANVLGANFVIAS